MRESLKQYLDEALIRPLFDRLYAEETRPE